MSRSNTSSVDMADGLKNSYLATQLNHTVGGKSSFAPASTANAARQALTAEQKSKAKKKAKLAKASRKKNK
jgi:hypothetical protein